MRPWLFDTISTDQTIQALLGGSLESVLERIVPRQSQQNINLVKPFIIFGLGNNTNENLSEDPDHIANRQFFTVWVHDEGGDYQKIDDIIEALKALLVGKSSSAYNISNIYWLETSQEFDNDTYETLFRYVRFQAIISKGAPLT